MLELEAALEKILAATRPLPPESVSLEKSFQRFCANDALAPSNLPPFDNSAMDGYALRAVDLAKASLDRPVTLKRVGTYPAGHPSGKLISSGQCARIFTGTPLPEGCDCVVMQEDVDVTGDEIVFREPAQPWDNLRFKGEDVKTGAVICAGGESMTAARLALFAALGLKTATVRRRPVVGLIATGNELVEPGEDLPPGKIYESNRAGLAALVHSVGGCATKQEMVKDDETQTRELLERTFESCDVVVSSGGVSAGDFDFVKTAFTKLGGSLDFWKIAIKPGKPFVFGRFHDKLFFGLPGNPVSAMVGFWLLVRPALLRLQGASDVRPETTRGALKHPMSNHAGRRHFVRVQVSAEGEVTATGIQASHILSSAAGSNGLVDIPPGTDWEAGRVVSVIRW